MSSLDIATLMVDLKNTASSILKQDITTFKNFQERQLKAIARQAALVANGIATGEITEETRPFLLNGIKDLLLNFVKTLIGLIMVTVEKVWNALVMVVWAAISTATGVIL